MRNGILAAMALFFLTVATSAAHAQLGTPLPAPSNSPQSLPGEPLPPPKAPQPVPVDPLPPLNPPQPFQTEQLTAPKTLGPTGGPVPAYGPYPDAGALPRQQAEPQGRLFFWNTQPTDDLLADGRNRAWVNLDFLVWWLKPGPLPVPLVTTGSANDNIPGALGQPNTTVLFGQHNLDFNTLAGANVSVGMWLPQCPVLGFEAGYLGLQSSSIRYSAFSDPNGNQIIARPIINAQTGTEQSYIDSFPGAASGGITVLATTQFDSWEINAVVNMLHTPNLNWDVIIGFRSLDLFEDLQIQDTVVPLAAGTFTFGTGPADPPNALTDFDCFRTSNHFYGGQIGSRLNWTAGLFDLSPSY